LIDSLSNVVILGMVFRFPTRPIISPNTIANMLINS